MVAEQNNVDNKRGFGFARIDRSGTNSEMIKHFSRTKHARAP